MGPLETLEDGGLAVFVFLLMMKISSFWFSGSSGAFFVRRGRSTWVYSFFSQAESERNFLLGIEEEIVEEEEQDVDDEIMTQTVSLLTASQP